MWNGGWDGIGLMLMDEFVRFNNGWWVLYIMVYVELIPVFGYILPAIYLTHENPINSIRYGTAVKIPTFLRHFSDVL